MCRKSKYSKFLVHIFYLFMFSYFVEQSNYTVVKIQRIDRFIKDIRHILIWTEIPGIKFDGQKEFYDRHCSKTNCYFTKNRTFLSDLRYFDAIMFNVQQVSKETEHLPDLPKVRGYIQKYIFAANDSSDNYPVCDPIYDGFFNWTWTYRKDSTIPYKFISVHTVQGHQLSGEIIWRGNMKKLNEYRRKQLDTKSKAAAIFLDKCHSRSKREEFVNNLQKELAKYNHTVDIYGNCGPLKCKRRSMTPCNYRIRKDYFFYLALEDSISPGFLGDEVLHAYKNDAVPIVFGGETYLNVLPKDSFLDAKRYHNISNLAKQMHRLISHRQLYYDMFKWKQYYAVGAGAVLDPCKLCEALNIPTWLHSNLTYNTFRSWWNSKYELRCDGSLP